MDRVFSNGKGRAAEPHRPRTGFAAVWALAIVAGNMLNGTSVSGDGFDGFVIPQRSVQAPLRGPVRTADVSVLVPPADAPLPLVQPGTVVDGEAWAGGEAWDHAGAGAAGLDGAAAPCGSCSGAGCAECSAGSGFLQRCCGDACPRWVVQVDALMLWQGNIASRPLLSAYDPTTMTVGPTALNANQAQPPMSAGPRVGLFYNLNQIHSIEGNYFQVRPFAVQALTGPGSFVQNGLAGSSYSGANSPVFGSAGVFTRAGIQSAELNWRMRECRCPITWLAGFRWVEWDQQLHIDQTASGSAATSLFRTDTINNLYGGQLGMDLGLWTGATFNVNGIGKAGAFLNHAAQASRHQNSLGAVQAARAEADGMAFFGELGVNGSLQLTPWLAWRLGYSLFWLSGVAVPANQLSVTNLATSPPTARLDANGSVLLHGVTTGLEARW